MSIGGLRQSKACERCCRVGCWMTAMCVRRNMKAKSYIWPYMKLCILAKTYSHHRRFIFHFWGPRTMASIFGYPHPADRLKSLSLKYCYPKWFLINYSTFFQQNILVRCGEFNGVKKFSSLTGTIVQKRYTHFVVQFSLSCRQQPESACSFPVNR